MQQSIEWFADIKREYCRRVGVQAYRALKRALRTRGERSPLSNDE